MLGLNENAQRFLGGIGQRFFGSSNERKLRPMQRRVQDINALEPAFEAKSNDEFAA